MNLQKLNQPFFSNLNLFNKNSLPYVFVFLMLCIPLGPSLKSIGIISALSTVFFLPQFKADFKAVLKHPLTLAIIVFVAYAFLSCTWSIASPSHQFSMLEKYMKLLFIPFIAIGFVQPKIRFLAMHAFILAMGLSCAISICHFLSSHPWVNPDPGKVFYNHIITGYMMAFAAYLSAWFAIHSTSRVSKSIYSIVTIIFTVQIFAINMSRTGYMIYIILFTILLLQHCSLKKSFQYGLLSFFIIGFLGLLMLYSPNFLHGIHMVTQDIQLYSQGVQNTNVGFRFQFHDYAKQLFWAHPLIGQGIGGFHAHYLIDNPIPLWPDPNPDPHSQYWLIASELGALGCLSYAFIFIFLFQLSMQLRETKFLLHALLITMVIACSSDTLLANSGIGYFFVGFVGLCWGEYMQLYRSKDLQVASKSPDIEYA